MQKKIVITGCSTGIGLASAHAVKARGWRVLATARKPEDVAALQQQGFEAFLLDYSSSKNVQRCATEIIKATDGVLDALFNNGAYGQVGAVEDLSRGVLERQFAANFFGWHEFTVALLPSLRAAVAASGQARIINCSSVLGLAAMKWRGAYNASKFALEGLTDTLRLELQGSGIAVVTINPGPIATAFTKNAMANMQQTIDLENTHYKAAYQRQLARLGKGGSNKFRKPPESVAEKLLLALESKNPKAHYYVTTPTYIMAIARRILPQGLLDKFMQSMSDQ